MTYDRSSRLAVVAILLLLTAGPGAAAAQTTATSGIGGRITDATGGVLPGVTVTLTSPALQVPQLATTSDENGRYRFSPIPGGVYRLTFSLLGFSTVIREDLQVGIGTVVTIDPRLAVGAIEEALTVRGDSPIVDVRTTTATTNLPRDLIGAMPTSRGVGELVKLAPGTRGSTNYGAVGTISHTYDGVQARDTFRYPDVGSLEEVQIRAVGNDAEVATAGVNFIAAIKSGGNQFHGSYIAQWEGERLSGSNIDDRLRAQGITSGNPRLLYRDLSGDVGGRIVKDRLWFYVAARRLASKDQIIGFSGAPGPDGMFFTADDVQGNSDQTMTVRPTSKATLQLNPKQRFNFVYMWEEQRSLARSAGAFIAGNAVGNYYLPNDLKKVEWTYNPTSRSILNVFVGNTQWNSKSLPYTDDPPAFDNTTRRITGAYVNSVGSDSTPAGSNSERWIYNATYSYFRSGFLGGDHDVKAGVEATREWYNKFQEARDTGTGGRGNDFRLYTENGAAFEALLYNSPFLSLNSLNTQSYFVRDSWLVNDRFTLSLGLRVEHYDAFLPKQSKPAGPYSPAAEYPALDVYSWWNPAPRVAMSYALTPDKRTVLKATYGRFNDVNNAQEGRTFNQNDYFAWRYKWNDLNGNRTLDYPGELGALVATESAQGAGLKILNHDLEQPKEDEATVHVERELAGGLSVRTGYVYKRLFDKYEEVNPARPFDAFYIAVASIDPGPDGTRGTPDDGGPFTYYDYDPSLRGAQFDQSKRVNTPGYTDRFHNVEFTMTKRMSNRWQVLTSYLATHGDTWRSGTVQTPNNFYPKMKYWESSFKLSGSVLLPLSVQASSYYQFLSGAYWGRTARFTAGLRQLSSLTLDMEEPTANRRPAQRTLDVRLERTESLPRGQELRWGVELYNAFNSNFLTNSSTLSGVTFGRITAIAPAQRARLVASYKF